MGYLDNERIILCEGLGDVAFLEKLIQARGLPDFLVTCPRDRIDPGGRDGFCSRLRGFKPEGIEKASSILIVSDNDDNPIDSFQKVCTMIENAEGYAVPQKPLTVARNGSSSPPVVVLMVPWTGEIGQLETLCLRAMRNRWPEIAACVDAFTQCTETDKWPRGKEERMRLRSMITSICRKDPNTSLQHAWSDNRPDLIPLNDPVFDQITGFLKGFDTLIENS